MHRADVALNQTQINLFAIIAAGNIDCTDSIKGIEVTTVSKLAGRASAVIIPHTVEPVRQHEGLGWIQRYRIIVEGVAPIDIDVDTQRGVLKNPALAEHADLVLTIGIETENLNRLPQ